MDRRADEVVRREGCEATEREGVDGKENLIGLCKTEELRIYEGERE